MLASRSPHCSYMRLQCRCCVERDPALPLRATNPSLLSPKFANSSKLVVAESALRSSTDLGLSHTISMERGIELTPWRQLWKGAATRTRGPMHLDFSKLDP